jgi:hypothetical protein
MRGVDRLTNGSLLPAKNLWCNLSVGNETTHLQSLVVLVLHFLFPFQLVFAPQQPPNFAGHLVLFAIRLGTLRLGGFARDLAYHTIDVGDRVLLRSSRLAGFGRRHTFTGVLVVTETLQHDFGVAHLSKVKRNICFNELDRQSL